MIEEAYIQSLPVPYSFPKLSGMTFRGLPGLLVDSLPDRFGNALIDVWLAIHGQTPESFNAVKRLCYTERRGMDSGTSCQKNLLNL